MPIVDKADKDLMYKFVIDENAGFKILRKSDNTTMYNDHHFVNDLLYSCHLFIDLTHQD